MRGKVRSVPAQGFTLLELLVVIAILLMAALIGFPALQNLLVRTKLEGIARETAVLVQLSRQEAIKRSVPTVIQADYLSDEVLAFADVDNDGLFTPDPAKTHRTVDYEVARLPLPKATRAEASIYFWGPLDGQPEQATAIDGFSADPGGGPNMAILDPDGSVRAVGAFRFGDSRGNHLEVRIAPAATARVEIRKYSKTGVGSLPPGFYASGTDPDSNEPFWEWY